MLLLLGKEKINDGCFLRSQHRLEGRMHSPKTGKEFAECTLGPLPPAASSFFWVTARKASALGFRLLPLSWGACILGGRRLRLLAALP